LAKMYQLLTSDLCAWDESQVTRIENPSEPAGIGRKLLDSYGDAKDVALFYYVGHGHRDEDNKLILGLADSVIDGPYTASTGLQFDAVKRALRASKATVKIIFLDCCNSGLAGSESDLVKGTGGAYLVAATRKYGTAKFDTTPGALTYFTRHLARVIEQGITSDSEALTLDEIIAQVSRSLVAAHLPVPTDIRHDLHGYAFARNQAFRPRSRLPLGVNWRLQDIPPPSHRGKITCIAINSAGDLAATGSTDGTVAIHEFARDDTCSVLHRLGLSNDERRADVTNGMRFQPIDSFGDLITQEIAKRWLGRNLAITGLTFDPRSSELAVSSGVRGLKFWIQGGKQIDVGVTESRLILPAFSSDGTFLVSTERPLGCDVSVLGWWDATGKVSYRVDALGVVCSISSRPAMPNPCPGIPAANEIFACGYRNGTVRFWSFIGGAPVGPVLHEDPGIPVQTLAFHPDGRSLATVNQEGLISIWSIANFEERFFTASQSDGISVQNACRLPVRRRLSGKSDGISAVAYSPDGAWLATGHLDGSVRMWDSATATEIGHGPIHGLENSIPKGGAARMITGLVFTPNARLLVAVNANGQMFIWRQT
jgi:WD40 repeat protein